MLCVCSAVQPVQLIETRTDQRRIHTSTISQSKTIPHEQTWIHMSKHTIRSFEMFMGWLDYRIKYCTVQHPSVPTPDPRSLVPSTRYAHCWRPARAPIEEDNRDDSNLPTHRNRPHPHPPSRHQASQAKTERAARAAMRRNDPNTAQQARNTKDKILGCSSQRERVKTQNTRKTQRDHGIVLLLVSKPGCDADEHRENVFTHSFCCRTEAGPRVPPPDVNP